MREEVYTKAQHTPGPWTIQLYTNHVGWSVNAPGDGCIAERWYTVALSDDFEARMLANANLIAAAPEMYEALDRICYAISPTFGPSDGDDVAAFDEVCDLYGGAMADGYLEIRRLLAGLRAANGAPK